MKRKKIKTEKLKPLEEFCQLTVGESLIINQALSTLRNKAHATAKLKGWYDPPKTDLECLMLVVSELAEIAEELRNGETRPIYYKDGSLKPEGVAVEIADVFLRLLDYAGYKGYDLAQAITVKHAYNLTRPRRHGKVM